MIISEDTIWSAGDIIDLGGLVQVAEGVTLTIEAGAMVRNGAIQVFGSLEAQGTMESRVSFDQVDFSFGSDSSNPGRMEINFAHFNKGKFLDVNPTLGYGSFNVADSEFLETKGFHIWYPTSDSAFLRNIFDECQGLSVGTDSTSQVIVEANSFINPTKPIDGLFPGAIVNWAAYGAPLIVRYNTFSLPDGSLAVELPVWAESASVVAEGNFFGTTDSAIIARMILDRADDVNRASFVSFVNFLTAPHADAPIVPLILRGRSVGELMIGGVLGDTLNGGLGADTMVGGAGNDTYVVDNAADAVTEISGGGEDTIRASVSYTLASEVEVLELTGVGVISGTGNDRANLLVGNAGANVLDGALGADTMMGGIGNDIYLVDNLSDVIVEATSGGADTARAITSYVLAENVENLELTGTFAINGTGNAIGNSITGNSAANIIDGGAGVDTMSGGAGNDIYTVDTTGDRVIEMAEGGFDIVRSSATYTLGAKVENLELTGVNAINATGNALSNRITGNTAANVLNGGLGTDTMVGGAGNDTYVVDNAGDRVIEVAGGGSDLVRSSVSFVLGTDFESLQLTGSIVANGVGNSLENRLVGNAATNALDGRGGNDTIIGGGGSDAVIGGTGNDSISGDAGNDTLSGQNGIDVLTGGAGADVLGGGAGNDLLNGGSGRDKLSGDTGSDTLIGGGELDVFVFAGKFGADVITDFRNGADVIDLSGRGLSFADLKIRTVGDDTVIVLDTGRIVLEDFSAGSLRSGMFDLV
ncbi:calcium-binding protein (plasmid) [Gemmobacter fulvus]|uniref:Calcium-binding protein n=1 Tax=Gemmobacter fulvus TaxID=2840474 RepID=A0A975S3I9_9RHOB|nr:calcium-binding protein [Gemmobacter fulvus]MBT9247904.1 calcium-binding protein [Gemmobacter fulvus]QWK93274.1 calcium-binding protein [Gemmobacter fulvus]